jgi:hypothetical protein
VTSGCRAPVGESPRFCVSGQHPHVIRTLLTVGVGTLVLFLTQPPALAQWVTTDAWTTFVPATAVSFAISAGQNSYAVQEPITLSYRIVNISNHALYVPRASLEGCPTVTLYVWAWFENSTGQRSGAGVGSSCSSGLGYVRPTLTERMNKAAVLLQPGEHVDGSTGELNHAGFPPGAYRIEATLYGWRYESFSAAELAELARMGNPFLRGEIPASMRVTLTP